VFSSQFGLPACTSDGADPCFQKVDQNGGTTYPATNAGWALEISLDIQWAHAVSPGAKILLVEATTNSYANLFAAVDYARTHADYVSMSWGSSEFNGEAAYDSHFPTGGTASYFVSAGDNGTPAEYPSSSPNVLSIGGTKLTFNGSTLTSETGWTDGGGGCSTYESKNAAQVYPAGLCTTGKRATPDISLDADPASGVSVYDTTQYNGATGWFVVGGTSASAPMIAARAAQTGTRVDAAYVYGSNVKVRDITVGNNGAACLTGFDLCTGRGTWVDSDSLASSPPPATTGVGASSISYSLGSNRSLLITVHVKNNSTNAAVSGATVKVAITRNAAPYATGSATTNTSGNVTFKISRAPSGTYSTSVTGITKSGMTWDGVPRTTSYTKS